jgi:recombination protein RecA
MATPARAHLESLLRARKLDATLPGAHPLVPDEATVAPTGVPTLDARLNGGWPRGHVSEIVGSRSSGRTRVMVQSLTAATQRGELAALVDATDSFDPESAVPLAPAWPYFLWIRGHQPCPVGSRSGAASASGGDVLERIVDRAIKAAGLVLQAGGFGVVALDLADVPQVALRRLPFTTWMRFQRLIEGRDTAGLIVAAESLGRSAQGVTVRLDEAGEVAGGWQGSHECGRLFRGLPARARLGRARWQSDDEDAVGIA